MKRLTILLVVLLVCSSCVKTPKPVENIDVPVSVSVKVDFAETYDYHPAANVFLLNKSLENNIVNGNYPFCVIESKADLDTFEKQSVFYYSLDSDWDDLPDYYETSQKFDNAFFEQNNLIITFFTSPGQSIRHKLGNTYIQSGILYTEIEEIITSDDMDTVVGCWFAFITVSKKDMEGLNGIVLKTPNMKFSDEMPEIIYPEGTATPVRVRKIGVDEFVFDNQDSKTLTGICKEVEYSETLVSEKDRSEYFVDIDSYGERYSVNVKKGYIRKININEGKVILYQASLTAEQINILSLIFSRLKGNL